MDSAIVARLRALFPGLQLDYDSSEVQQNNDGQYQSATDIFGDGQIPDVTLLHFLGVDHIGHTHSSEHHSMRAKLRQMDTVAISLVELLQQRHQESVTVASAAEEVENSLFLLMGDHGKFYCSGYIFAEINNLQYVPICAVFELV